MRALEHIRKREWPVVAVAYGVVTCAMLWRLVRRAGSVVQDPGDPLFEIWVMRWVQHALVTDPLDMYHANAFYPLRWSLAYSEEAISTALLAWPVQLLTGNDVLAYNVMLISSFWLVAFAIWLLAKEFGAISGAAFIAGIVAAFAPVRFGQLSHLHMLVIGWLPLALWALTRWVRGGRDRWLLLASGALAVQLLGSLHLAVFTTLTLALYLPLLLWRERRWRFWTRPEIARLAAALALPYLLLVPTLIPHLHASEVYGLERSREEAARLASEPMAYLAVPVHSFFWPHWLNERTEPLFPGIVAIAGVVLALAFARRLRWPALFATLLALVAGIFSLGFETHVAGRTIPLPYALVYDIVTPVQNIRAIARYGLLTAIGLPLLAAFGYSAAWKRLRPRIGDRAPLVGLTLTTLLSLLACVELYTPPGANPVNNGPETMAVYEWLADQPGPVIEFPASGLLLGKPSPPGGIFQPIQMMYGSTRHWRPLVNGYSGFIPSPHWQLLAAIHHPDASISRVHEGNVGLLQDLGVRWIVIHRWEDYDWQEAIDTANTLPQLRRAAEVGDSVVYELVGEPRRPLAEPAGWFRLPERATGAAPYPAQLVFDNPNDNMALLWLDLSPDVRLTWRREDGSVARVDALPLEVPAAVPAGESHLDIVVGAPIEPGRYQLVAETDTALAAPSQQWVIIDAPPDPNLPVLELVSIDWQPPMPLHPGDVLMVEITWRVLAPLPADYAATVQLLDVSGERRASSDLLPGVNMPSTRDWQVGDEITLQFPIVIDARVPPGEYRLLAAVYGRQAGFPRLPLRLNDGTIATEAVIDGVLVVP